jgi:hypothetical protein
VDDLTMREPDDLDDPERSSGEAGIQDEPTVQPPVLGALVGEEETLPDDDEIATARELEHE